jgi:pentatricopeptide repeat protein
MINACVRAGETARAMQYLATMEAAGVAANEVTYTALIKGLAQDGDMAAVRDMLRTMRKNVRGSTVQYSGG